MYVSRKRKEKKNYLIDINGAKVLNLSVLYGANASGKSNFIKSIEYSRNLILMNKFNKTKNSYFKGNKENIDKLTKFTYEISLNDKNYSYGITLNLNNQEYLSEWLYEIGSSEKIIYEIDYKTGKFNHKLDKNERVKLLFEDITKTKNILFLNEFIRRGYDESTEFDFLANIYNWFNKKLDIIFPTTKLRPAYFEKQKKERLIDLLDSFYTGIKDYEFIEQTREKVNIPDKFLDMTKENLPNEKATAYLKSDDHLYKIIYEDNIKFFELKFSHGGENLYSLGEESDGTKRLIDLLILILNTKKESEIIFVDEIDRSLHPKLTHKFIELFLKLGIKKQLIVSTHESSLLDQDLLRRDMIWFIDKNYKSRSSNIYSLDEFKVRFDKDIHKAYLEGRYRAVPLFDSFDCLKWRNKIVKKQQ